MSDLLINIGLATTLAAIWTLLAYIAGVEVGRHEQEDEDR